jgi:hypothetical protein
MPEGSEPFCTRDEPPHHKPLLRLTINSGSARFKAQRETPMTLSATLTALPELQPDDPGARLLLFGVR